MPATLLIEAEVPYFTASAPETRFYEVVVGEYIERFAHRSAMQSHWVRTETLDMQDPNYGWGNEIRTWMVTADGCYVGCFRDREEFFQFVEYYLRGKVVEVVEVGT